MPPGSSVLPVSLAGFVGREREVAEVRRLLAANRLLTLTGAGGSGKTRLAIEVVAPFEPAARTWIELAGVTDPARVAAHVAEQLGMRDVRADGVIDAIAGALGPEPHLLVLDNCEHVIEATARLVEALVRACPRLQILATSREPLALAGERAWLVPALQDPDAVRLFVERARDVAPSFTLDAATAATIAEICRRLDGLPLAIELAAARVRVLAPGQILARLHDSFRLLSSSSRTVIPRHQTLRATMDWSYSLLAPEEQHLLDRLSVFGGGFTLDAAEACCGDADVLDVLARLVDRSLVTMREVGGSARYTLLETVRQYAAEKLRTRGEDAALHERHAAYVAALLAAAEPHLIAATRRPWLAGVERELDNVRAALAWTHEHAPALHLELTGRLCWYWFATGAWTEARTWSEGALALPVAAAPTIARGKTLFAAAVIACMQADGAVAEPWLVETVSIARGHGDAQLAAYAENYLGMALIQQRRDGGDAPARSALAWFREHRDLYGARLSLLLLGSWHVTRGDVADAVPLFEEAVDVAREFGLPRELGIALQMLGGSMLQRGELVRAGSLLHEALIALQQDPQAYFLARALDMIGILVARRGGTTEAVRLMGAADAARRRIGASAMPIDRAAIAPWIATLRAALGDGAYDAAWAAGAALDRAEALSGACALCEIAPSGPSVLPDAPEPPTAPDSALVVRGLGPLAITCGGTTLEREAWSSPRARELLLYLLCHPGGRRREEIGLQFWPDASAAQVKNSFHVLLHRLRKILGRGDIVNVDDERYRINPAIAPWFDAAVFEREVRAGRRDAARLAAAIALYRGDLFEGGEVAGDWHFEHQDRLRLLYRDGLSTLADLHLAAGDDAAATSVLERLVRGDELREDAHRRLLVCYARSGQRDRALHQFDRLVEVLRDELSAVPSRMTVELADRIRRDEPV